MAVAEVEVPAEPAKSHDGLAEATRGVDELFQWSTYVHVGTGADKCPHGQDGVCQDTEHFHGWLRLPNDWQTRDIQEKAEAARARRRRTLKDPESDARISLEDWLDLWQDTEQTWENLLGRIANRRVIEKANDMRQDLIESEEFEHYPADLEERQRLSAMPTEERDADEFNRLNGHIDKFVDALNKETLAERERQIHQLKQLPKADVVDIERRERMKELGDERFVQVFYQWAYFTCVLRPIKKGFPTSRVFESPEALRTAPEEVTAALRDAYRKLESRTISRGDVAGNS